MTRSPHILRDGIVTTLPYRIAPTTGKSLNLPPNPDCRVREGVSVDTVIESCKAARAARVRTFSAMLSGANTPTAG